MQDEVKVSQAARDSRVARYLSDQKAARENLATYPEKIRQRLEAWQTEQREWFSDTILEIVAEFITIDDAIRHQVERETLARMEPVAWRPIRTAPRNETMIVLGGEGQQTWVGFFSGWNNYWTTGEVDRSRDHVMHTPQPTHWMPLPPAPEAGQ